MKGLLSGFVFFGLLAACDSGDPCETLCETYAEVGCDNEVSVSECSSQCEEPEECVAEYNGYLKCLSKTSASDYTCDDEGDAILEAEVCTVEALEFLACAMADME
jgi:hypothetical protein